MYYTNLYILSNLCAFNARINNLSLNNCVIFYKLVYKIIIKTQELVYFVGVFMHAKYFSVI
jgi:hypothetical protein